MKKIFTYLLFAAVALCGCEKEQHSADIAENDGMNVTITLGSPTKDSAGFLTPYYQNGVIWMHRGWCRLVSVAVDDEGNPDFDNYMVGTFEMNSYYGDLIIGSSRKKAVEWFAHSPSGKCIFFAALERNQSFSFYTVNTHAYNQETGQYEDTSETVNLDYTFPYDIDGDGTSDTILVLVKLTTYQQNTIEDYGNFGTIYRDVAHLVGACAPVPVSAAEVLADGNVLNLGGFAPANSLLRFNLKTADGMPDVNVSKVQLSMRSLDGEGCHTLFNSAYMDFRNYQNESAPYRLVGVNDFYHETGFDGALKEVAMYVTIDENGTTTYSNYHSTYENNDFDYFFSNSEYRKEGEEDKEWKNYAVTSTPSKEWFLMSIIPQSAETASSSYLIFKFYDENETIVSRITKDFPAEGFAPGAQYEFTLALEPYTPSDIDPDSESAGKYQEDEDNPNPFASR